MLRAINASNGGCCRGLLACFCRHKSGKASAGLPAPIGFTTEVTLGYKTVTRCVGGIRIPSIPRQITQDHVGQFGLKLAILQGRAMVDKGAVQR